MTVGTVQNKVNMKSPSLNLHNIWTNNKQDNTLTEPHYCNFQGADNLQLIKGR